MGSQESELKAATAPQDGQKTAEAGQRKARTLAEAKQEVEALVHRLSDSAKDTEVKIHLWWEDQQEKAPACVGVRIAEISWVTQHGSGICGSSCFAGSPESLGFVAAAERCIIERMICTVDDKDWDNEIADADWRLKLLLEAKVTLRADEKGNLAGTAS